MSRQPEVTKVTISELREDPANLRLGNSNLCPRCANDLSKECVVFTFAFHQQDGVPRYENPGDSTPLIQCSCGVWLNEDHTLVNEGMGTIPPMKMELRNDEATPAV